MNKQQTEEEVNINDFKLIYSLTETEIELEGEKYITYGIEVEKQSLCELEKAVVNDITTDRKKAEEIIEKMKNNEVTPVHLYDVMENFL